MPAADSRPLAGSGNPQALRASNRDRVVSLLTGEPGLSQAELSTRTGLSPASVSSLVKELASDGIVDVRPGLRGRRRVSEVTLAWRGETVLAIDLGHRRARMAIADLSGTVLAESVDDLPANWHQHDDASFLRDMSARLFDADTNDSDRVVVAAIGIPAPIDPASGLVSDLAPGWTGTDVPARLHAALQVPVVLDNDANLAAVGEARLGAGRGCRDVIYVKLSHGLGAGLILDGRLYHGGLGVAGEIGHTSIRPDGPLCACGGRGCMELYASGRAIAAALADLHGSRPTLRQIVDQCATGEPSYVRAVADAGEQLGVVLGNLANVLAPSRIVIGGELAAVGPALLDSIRRAVHQGSARTLRHQVQVVPGELGDRAGLLGAVELGLGTARANIGIPAATSVITQTRHRALG